MVSCTIENILKLHQKLIQTLDSSDYDIESKIIEELLINIDNLIIKSCKTESFNEYNRYFTKHILNNKNKGEFTIFKDEDYKCAKHLVESSTKLKNKLYNRLTKDKGGLFDAKDEEKTGDDYKLMEFTSNEHKNRFIEASEKVSLAMDIGGTFIKVMFKFKVESEAYHEYLKHVYTVYLDTIHLIEHVNCNRQPGTLRNHANGELPQMLEFVFSMFMSIKVNGGILAFKYVPLSDLGLVISTIKEKNLHTPGKTINVTGGGAFRHHELLTKEFGDVNKYGEIFCAPEGINFVQNLTNSAIEYDLKYRTPHIVTMDPVYPSIICSAGSGIFLLKAVSSTEYIRLNGSAISGGTGYGLVNYLMPINEPRTFVKDLRTGTNVLDSFTNHTTESFKTVNKSEPYGLSTSLGEFDLENKMEIRGDDVNKSIIDMISYNTGELGYLVAKAFEAKRVIFVGNYICNNTMASIAAGFAYCSDVYDDKSIQILFPFQAAYIPTIGSFLMER